MGQQKSTRGKTTAGRSRARYWMAGGLAAGLAILTVVVLAPGQRSAGASTIEFTDVREQTREFMGYNKSIQLTPEQEAVKKEALSAIPASCCSDNSAYTCCCPCNMAKTWWGLANYLIAERGAGVEEVRATVQEWMEFINPQGFSGDSCYTGGCVRPFHRNGCGGMNEAQVVF